MNDDAVRTSPITVALGSRSIRFDRLEDSEVYPESIFLRLWAARQAADYGDLLRTIAAAPRSRPSSRLVRA